MSGEAIKWARLQRIANPKLKSMLNALAVRADKKGSTWVSQATLADDMGLSVRQVSRLLGWLERLGVISRKARSNGRDGRLTDEISLPLHKTFDLDKAAVATGHGCPVRRYSATGQNRGFQPDIRVRGIEREQEELDPSQEGTSTYQDVAQGGDGGFGVNVIPFGRRVA